MQGFDAAVHHLREAGIVGDLAHRDAGFAQGFEGAARGEQLDVLRDEGLGQGSERGFVGDGNEGASDASETGIRFRRLFLGELLVGDGIVLDCCLRFGAGVDAACCSAPVHPLHSGWRVGKRNEAGGRRCRR